MHTDVSSAAGRIPSFENYSGTAPENYERYFVPAIGAPLAAELLDVALLRPGEHVLDVACGTGIVTRLAAERVGADGADGTVAGVDINPGMLAVARSAARPELGIDWHEAGARRCRSRPRRSTSRSARWVFSSSRTNSPHCARRAAFWRQAVAWF